ncbi:lipocalin-like domain-containing protein [Lutimaribacter marinistellae]|uniref:Lipocalin-like domain-containing protein n=1 Tax=Lutimaribacter marinistellae TaxID=1820329 RepID=A0ABV7TLA0_9RHOB
MNVRALILALLLPVMAQAQGFAGLGTTAEGFAVPDPAYRLSFPTDHGAHPAYRIEWWYVTATLKGDDGRDYGVQWTLFRSALAPEERADWQSPQLWMGHAGLTTPEQHYSAERLARGGIGQAGVTTEPFSAWIDEWHLEGPNFDQLTMAAAGEEFAYALEMEAQGPLVLHGVEGYSVKSADGQASHYYSQPFYAVEGVLTLPGGDVAVTGNAWLDREWSSQPLSEDQSGWDWFSLSFDTGEKMMAFRLRGGRGDFTSGTWIAPDGTAEPIPDGRIEVEPLREARVAGREVPVEWRLRLPARGVDVEVVAMNDQSWMDTSFAYWEGPVTITGSHAGRGYLEMTGYE